MLRLLDEPHLEGQISLRSRVFAATKWTTISFVATFAAQFLQLVILARILAPSEVGLISIVSILTGFADLFVGMGIAQSIVQRRGVTSRELSSLYWLNLIAAAIVGAVIYSSSWAVAAFFSVPVAAGMVQLSSAIFLVSAIGQVPRAVLEKRLEFHFISVAEVAGAAVLLLVATGLAIAGFGAYSAIWALIASAAVRSVILRIAARRLFTLRYRFKPRETRRFLALGILQSVDAVVNFIQGNISTIATGRIVGPAAMGGYTLAYNTAVNTPAKINPIVTRVMFPVFAAMQADRARMRSGYAAVNAAVGFASIPALLGIALVATDFISVIYGPQYRSFGGVLAVLCFVGMLRTLGNPVGFVLMATDNMKLGLSVNVAKAAIGVPIILGGASLGGALGAAAGALITQVLGFGVSAWMLKRTIGLTLRRYLWSSALPFVVALPMVIAVAALGVVLPATLDTVLALLIKGVVAVAVLAATFLLSRDPLVLNFRIPLQSRLQRRRNDHDIAVLLPEEERFDGTGGAVAHWVDRIYARSPRDYAVYASPAPRSTAATSPHPLGNTATYRRYLAVVDLLASAAGLLSGRLATAVRRRLRFNGRAYLWAIAPAVLSSSLIHVHNRPQYAIGLRRMGFSGRIVLHMHNDLADYVSPDEADALARVDLVLFCSDFIRGKARRDFGLANSETVHNGVDPWNVGPAPLPSHHRLAFAGRLTREKGVLEAIEVTVEARRQTRRPYTLRIFGGPQSGSNFRETPYYREVIQAAADANDEFGLGTVDIRGHVAHGELLTELAASWIFLYPCIWDEPFGMVVAEAMSVGTPVVSYARGGIPEIVQNGVTGVLLPVDRPLAEFVPALERLEQTGSHNDMADAARAHVVRQFSWDRIAQRTFELL